MSSSSTSSAKNDASSRSSSRSCLWSLVLIVSFALVAFTGSLETATATNPETDDDTPGLDFGTGSMFDRIATKYDTINRVLALRMDIGWRRVMTNRIGELLTARDNNNESEGGVADAPWKILDMATGTADVALQLVDDLAKLRSPAAKGTTVLGLDPSENMLSVGRSKILDRDLQNQIVLETADARDLSGYYPRTREPSEKFDAATMAFGIRNVVPNREHALCEIHKLLKHNGVLAILEFSNPTYETDGILGAAAGIFIEHVVPFVGGLLSGGAKQEYRHLQNSIREFPAPGEFRRILGSLECPLREDDGDHYFYVGNYEMEETTNMNFGSVQLYIGRAVIRQKESLKKDDTKLPPIGSYADSTGEL